MQSCRPTYAEIDLEALRHNFDQLVAAAPGADLVAVVKADAYGHGAVPIAKACEAFGAAMLAVAMVEEAVELRQAGLSLPILVMGSVSPGCEHFYPEFDLTPYLFDLDTADRLSRAFESAGKTCRYHLKVDTGMGRIGFTFEQLPEALSHLQSLPAMKMAGVMSHLALADVPTASLNDAQIASFRQTIAQVRDAGFSPAYLHTASSAALFSRQLPECNLARPGIALYGGWPSAEFASLDLRPVMSLRSHIVQLKEMPVGAGVSYGHKFVCNRPSRIAVLPVGYADGYNRLLSNSGEMLLRGQRVPVVGTICMDWVMLDVTDVDGVVVGDEVTLLGNDGQGNVIRAEEWAEMVGTINYEVFCGISKRVPRVAK